MLKCKWIELSIQLWRKGERVLDAGVISDFITAVGFPGTVVVILFYILFKVNEQGERNDERWQELLYNMTANWQEVINNNTKAMFEVVDKLEDLDAMNKQLSAKLDRDKEEG